jgi:hypothetical protein
MIIFKKLPDGTWEKSGAILPTEREYRIAVDAENPERMAYPCADAVTEVENRIKAGTASYRFELASPPASYKKASRKAANKTIKKILRNPEAPKSKKKETGKQRRARLKREGKCTACGKRKARKGHCECKECNDYYTNWAAAKAKKARKR